MGQSHKTKDQLRTADFITTYDDTRWLKVKTQGQIGPDILMEVIEERMFPKPRKDKDHLYGGNRY